jgi:hypothetical protein
MARNHKFHFEFGMARPKARGPATERIFTAFLEIMVA